MAGHVFVIHGDLLKISADALLIPCDAGGEVLRHWSPYGPHPDRKELVDELRGSRVSGVKTIGHQLVRYVDTGSYPTIATAEWLKVGISDAQRAVVGDVTKRAAKHRRARPLIAMPLFGVGAGGFDAIRGEALLAQLDAAREAATDAEVDVVIVCFRRSDFAAIQRQRSRDEWDLPEELRAHAQSLAEEIKAGRLVLFLGAGVSAAAGIGDFAGLVAELEYRAKPAAGVPDHADLPARVAALQAAQSEDWINAEVADLVKQERYSLTHGLLASLRVREAITTNFDQLYEMSCERPFSDTRLEVLPWERGPGRNPWLLKAHGDPVRSGSLVLGTPSFDSFEADRATSAGVVRAMLALSREVLFVGYSLSDKNILRLVTEAARSHHEFGVEHPRLGTIIDIESSAIELDQNPARLGIRPSPGSSIPEAALRLQVLLDHLLWLATRDESSWLLDERYAALHDTEAGRQAAKRLREEQLPSSGNWPVVEHRLRQFGKRDTSN